MIEVLHLASGKLLISAGAHCAETDADDAAIDIACVALAVRSGIDVQRIRVMVARSVPADG